MSRLLAVVVVAACSGRAPAPTPVARHEVVRPDAGLTRVDAPSVEARPTATECTTAVDHMIDLDVSERPADQRPAGAELDRARNDLRTTFVPTCTEQLTRAQVDCIAHATTLAGAQACR